MMYQQLTVREAMHDLQSLGALDPRPTLALDVETTGLDQRSDKLRLVNYQPFTGTVPVTTHVRIVDVAHCPPGELDDYLRALAGFKLAAHNAYFDLGWFLARGIYPEALCCCTLLWSKVTLAGEFGREAFMTFKQTNLENCARFFTGRKLNKEEQTSEWSRPVLTESQLRYAAADVAILPPLVTALWQRLQGDGATRAALIESRALPAVAWLGVMGMPFRPDLWSIPYRTALARQDEIFARLRRDHLTNAAIAQLDGGQQQFGYAMDSRADKVLSSPKQLLAFMHMLGLRPKLIGRTREGVIEKDSTADDALALCDHPLADLLREYRGHDQIRKSFNDQWGRVRKSDSPVAVRLGRIFPSVKQCETETGRMSVAYPNLQQVPNPHKHPLGKDFRRAFRPPEGRELVVADFSQIELRLAAEISGDEAMRQVYLAGGDIHTEAAKWVLGKDAPDKHDRTIMKSCFSGDTEVLTPGGWVRFDALMPDVRVAQYMLPRGVEYNPARPLSNRWGHPTGKVWWDGDGGMIEFVTPLALRSFDDRELWHHQDRNSDILATPDHQIVYIDNNSRARRQPMAEVSAGNCRYFVAAGRMLRAPQISDEMTRLLAMVVADGSFPRNSNQIKLGFTKARKIERCNEVLRAAGVAYRARDCMFADKPGVDFTIMDGPRDTLLQFTTTDKVLSWRCLTDIGAGVYLDEAAFWDSHRIEGDSRTRVLFTSTQRQTVDVMQAMAATSDTPSTSTLEHEAYDNVSALWRLSYSEKRHPTWRASWQPSPVGRGTVYCVQVPSGAILIRRNGRAVVCGNCNFGLLYGAGVDRFRIYAKSQFGVDLGDDAGPIRERWFAAFPGIRAWHRDIGARLDQHHALTTRTLSGRPRKTLKSYSECLNSPVQGSGADITKLALARIYEDRHNAPVPPTCALTGDGWYPCAVIHDEIVLEVPSGSGEAMAAWLKAHMIAAGAELMKTVPCDAEASVRTSWAE